MVWAGKKDDDIEVVAKARDDARNENEDEYRRLLYVANGRSASVSVVDTATLVRRLDVPVGEFPWGVVIR